MWEISEKTHYNHRMNRRSEIEEAYECGFEEGYEKAMKEASYYHERRGRY
jgi:flagellar biosynthesis/type III secretory pathway protein FliH